MSKFNFTRQKYTNKINVWHEHILIGELDTIFREKQNIDWPKYRADKTLKLPHSERWTTTWRAQASANMATVGCFNSKEEAARQILEEHRKVFERQINDSQ